MTDLLVTGASGQFGAAAIRHLIDTLGVPANRIGAATRDPSRLRELEASGVNVVEADFDRPETLRRAFAGVGPLLIVSTDALGVPGKRLAQHQAAVHAAAEAGVRHVVYTSLPNAETSAVSFAPDHLGTEKAIEASGIPGWTILRNNWYAENVLLSLPQALASGTWYSAAGDGQIAYLIRDDLALAAATALASDFTGQRTLTLSGTRGYTAREIAGLASAATGRKLDVVPVPVDGLVQGLLGAGLPKPVAETIASFDAAAAAGHLDGTPDDYAELTGRQPTAFADWFATSGAKGLSAAKP